jgi:hypothetical protein
MAPVTQVIEIDARPAMRHLEAFASVLEKHAAALAEQAASFRADLEELMAAQDPGTGGEGM